MHILGRRRNFLALLLWLGCGVAMSSGPILTPIKSTAYIPVTAYYLGATLFGTGQNIKARFINSKAYWANQLYFINPQTGLPEPVFSFQDTGRGSQCPDEGVLIKDLGRFEPDEEIVFMLQTTKSAYAGDLCTGEACGPRYSGMNDTKVSSHYSQGQFAHLAGHIWAGAARLGEAQIGSMGQPCLGQPYGEREKSGTLMVYEDGADISPDDFVFMVTGVQMDVEKTLAPPAIQATSPFSPLTWVSLVAAVADSLHMTRVAYTLNGSNPELDSFGQPLGLTRIYQTPFSISQTMEVRAMTWGRSIGANVQPSTSAIASKKLYLKKAGKVYQNFAGQTVEAPCQISVSGGKVVTGETLTNSIVPVAIPVSVILPRAQPSDQPQFLDYAWRQSDPKRPSETAFTNGPELHVTTSTGFSFNLAYYSTQGEFINRAKGNVSEAMLAKVQPTPEGRRTVSLMWYPVSAGGLRVATGSYIVKGLIWSQPTVASSRLNAQACPDTYKRVLITFGYIRK